jgi:polyisoprenoid-binding protein YceI
MRRKFVVAMLGGLVCSLSLMGAVGAAETYTLDKSHTTVGFAVRHLVINTVRGQFREFDATLSVDPDDITKSSLQGTVKVVSIDTANAKRDKHLRSPDFFDADQYPEITFTSKRIEQQGEGYVMIGDFTMRGVSQEIALPFRMTDAIEHRKKIRRGFEARVEINRQDYGIAYSKLSDAGGLVVGNTVLIEINGEMIKQPSP